MRKESFLVKCWNTLWPLIIYIFVQNLLTVGLIAVVKENYASYALAAILAAAVICIPIYYRMYRLDQSRSGEEKRAVSIEGRDLAAIILAGAALAVFLNNVITLTPLPYLFQGYEEVNNVIYGGGIVLQILSAGFFCCIVEEMCMRGVVYHRMKQYWGKKSALFGSAVVFGLYHLNLVQGVYAFFLGLFFAWLYERYAGLWAPIIAHVSANLLIIFLSKSAVFQRILNTLTGFSLVTCISLLIFFYGFRWLKQTNPLVELEFVEKEADTLKKLTQEYKKRSNEEEEK